MKIYKTLYRRQLDYTSLLAVTTILLLLAVLGLLERLTIAKKGLLVSQENNKQLEERLSSHYMLWVMDESCSTQIKNNTDGVLRLRLSPSSE